MGSQIQAAFVSKSTDTQLPNLALMPQKAKGKVYLSPKAKVGPLDLAIEAKEKAFLPKPKLEAPHTHLLRVISVTKLDTSQKIAEGESPCTTTPCTNKLGASLAVGNNCYLMIWRTACFLMTHAHGVYNRNVMALVAHHQKSRHSTHKRITLSAKTFCHWSKMQNQNDLLTAMNP